MERPAPIEPEELLSNARWMRSLARSLVNDAASADDVVQEAMVVALRRPPDSGRHLRAWLSSVVSNVASNLRRGEQRLADRHARRGVDDDAADPAATLERLDTHRLIVDLVRELDEPLRSTIVFFYFEGLTSPEIGRRMGVSDATVRSRIHKALDELRTRLQRKFGSREAWCAVLLPLAPSLKLAPTTTAAANLTAGALTMGAVSKAAIVAVSLSLVGAGWWFVHERAEHDLSTAVAATPQSSEAQEPAEPIASTVSEREALAQDVDPASLTKGAARAKEGEAALASGSTYGVRARFVDSAGKPRDRVMLRVLEASSWGLSEESTTSGIDGLVEMSFPILEFRNPNLEFAATRAGCVTRAMHVSLIAGSVVDLGNIVLDREARVRGTVLDAQGAGVGDVTVGLSPVDVPEQGPGELRRRGSPHFDKLIVTRSDARGAFELAAVAAGKWRLWGHRDGLGYGVSEPFEARAGEEAADIDFEVPELLVTDTIRGIVIDPAGKPASRAIVTFAWASGNGSGTTSNFSNASGSFEILVNAETSGDLTAEDKEHRWTSNTKRLVPPGARDIMLQLAEKPPAHVVRLRVHGPANEPVRVAELMVFVRVQHNSYVGHREIPRQNEAGLYELPVPDSFFKLTVAAEGYVDGKLELDPQGLSAELDVSLELAPALRGRVFAAGQVVPAAVVEALPEVGKGHSLTVNGFPALMNPTAVPSATASEKGTFAVFLQSKTPVYLRCVAPGFAPTIVGPIRVESATDPIEIELTVGGSIAGRARDKDGNAVAGAIVGVTCGDGYPRTMRSGLDGGFRFDGLSAGSWLVIERDEEVTDATSTSGSTKERPIEWSCQVVAGRTTYFDLILKR